VGRAGLEPATLGLKVRREPLQPGALSRKVLQQPQAGAATNCSEMRVAETSPYSQPYSQPLSSQTKPKVVGVASVTEPPAPIYGLPADRPSSVQRVLGGAGMEPPRTPLDRFTRQPRHRHRGSERSREQFRGSCCAARPDPVPLASLRPAKRIAPVAQAKRIVNGWPIVLVLPHDSHSSSGTSPCSVTRTVVPS
jgi:hypothetical protein